MAQSSSMRSTCACRPVFSSEANDASKDVPLNSSRHGSRISFMNPVRHTHAYRHLGPWRHAQLAVHKLLICEYRTPGPFFGCTMQVEARGVQGGSPQGGRNRRAALGSLY